jgi:hypothetical protein
VAGEIQKSTLQASHSSSLLNDHAELLQFIKKRFNVQIKRRFLETGHISTFNKQEKFNQLSA